MILLDTDVLIDCLRGLPSAQTWLQASSDQIFGIPGIVAMELVTGCRDKNDLQQVQALIHRFNVIWPDAKEIEYAFELLVTYRLEFGVEAPDCIIAAMALDRDIPLYTFNLKHYQSFPDLEVCKPYIR